MYCALKTDPLERASGYLLKHMPRDFLPVCLSSLSFLSYFDLCPFHFEPDRLLSASLITITGDSVGLNDGQRKHVRYRIDFGGGNVANSGFFLRVRVLDAVQEVHKVAMGSHSLLLASAAR